MAAQAGADGPQLVLLHGLAGSGDWWKRNLPALSGAFRVTVIDLPGFGASHPDARLILDEVPAQVDRLLGELGIERAHVMGHSMGGLVAGGLAADHPERVDRLVLVDAGFLSLDPTWRHRITGPLRTLPWTSPTILPILLRDVFRSGPFGWPAPPPRSCARTGVTSCRPSPRRRSSSGASTIASATHASASRSSPPCRARGW